MIQRPKGFTVGVEHNHAGEVGLPETAKFTAAIKRKATDDLFRPASATVDEVLLQRMEASAAMPTLARLAHLARAASRCRQSKRPQDPADLDFNMDESISSILEGFYRAGIETREELHLIFATEEQLTLLSRVLSKAKRWYVDGTSVSAAFKLLSSSRLMPSSAKTTMQSKSRCCLYRCPAKGSMTTQEGVKEGAKDPANYPERGAGYR